MEDNPEGIQNQSSLGITELSVKNGNPYLAWAYMEAAQFALRFQPEAQRFYQRQLSKSRNNTVLARKAVAHKLARACYYIMRDLVPFEAMKAFG
jgi:transposase